MKQFLSNHYTPICVALFTVLSLILGFVMLGHKDFSLDELATALIVRDFATMLHIIRYMEGNMWLYYILLNFWQIFGTNEFALRSFSVIFGAATIPVIYLLGKKLFSPKVALVSIFLTCINVFFVSNEQNARSYSFLLFLTTLSSYFFTSYVMTYFQTKKEQKWYFLMTIFINILGVYAHLYTIFVIAAQVVALLLTKQKLLIKRIFIFILAIGVFLLPLALAPSTSGKQINWIPIPGIRNLIGTFLILSGDFPPIGVVYLTLLAGFVTALWKKRKYLDTFAQTQWKFGYLFLWLVLPIVVSFVFSLFVKPLYISMYFYICLIPFIMLISFIITKISKVWLQYTVLALILLLSSIRLYGWYSGNQQLELVITNNNEDWRSAAQFIADETQPEDSVLFYPPFVQENVNYYMQQEHKNFDTRREITLWLNDNSANSGPVKFDSQKLVSIQQKYPRVWFVTAVYTDAPVQMQQAQITKLLAQNYLVKRQVNFYAITAYYFVKK